MNYRNFWIFAFLFLFVACITAGIIISQNGSITSKTDEILMSSLLSGGFAILAALIGFRLNVISQRPVIKIEHVDVKAERQPYTMSESMYFEFTRVSDIAETVAKQREKYLEEVQKNEFSYMTVKAINETSKRKIIRFEAIDSWIKEVKQNIEMFIEFADSEEDILKASELLEKLIPALAKFKDDYSDGDIRHDFKDDPKKVCSFLEASIYTYIREHAQDINSLRSIRDWTQSIMQSGEAPPREVVDSESFVPKLTFFLGLSNLGKSPALIKAYGVINNGEIRVPITNDNFLGYIDVDPSSVRPVTMNIDSLRVSFFDHKNFYNEVISSGVSNISITLELANGEKVTKKINKLIDNVAIQI